MINPEAASEQVDPFYLRLLEEGKELFSQNKLPEAIKSLEIAAFGLIEDRPRLFEATLYLVVANYRLRQVGRAAFFVSEIERLNLRSEFKRPEGPVELYNQFLEIESLLRRLALAARCQATSKGETFPIDFSIRWNAFNRDSEIAKLKDLLPPPQPTAIQEAVKLEEALRQDPANGAVLIRLAVVYEELGHHDQARDVLKKYLKMNPDCAIAHFELGRILLQLRKPREALKEIEMASSILEGDIEYHYVKARAYEQLGEEEKASQEWERVKSVSPTYKDRDINIFPETIT